MKNSERNRMVLENFILHITGRCRRDKHENDELKFTSRNLYHIVDDYIKEDHVDGEGNPEDNKSEEQLARELLESKGYYVGNLWSVYDVKGKFECTSEQAKEVLSKAFKNDATYEQIWMSIDYAAENINLKRNRMSSKYFEISGYWKDDKEPFNGYIVKEFDDMEENAEDDERIFWYGVNEQDLKEAIELGEAVVGDFVITDYMEIDF